MDQQETLMTEPCDPMNESGPKAPDVADVLETQAAEIAALHRELIKSYEKELAFFANLQKRDAEAKKRDDSRLRKIWWLEAELRKQQQELDRTRVALRNLQNSAMGKVQRSYWKLRRRGGQR